MTWAMIEGDSEKAMLQTTCAGVPSLSHLKVRDTFRILAIVSLSVRPKEGYPVAEK